jgi:hypothetical protein
LRIVHHERSSSRLPQRESTAPSNVHPNRAPYLSHLRLHHLHRLIGPHLQHHSIHLYRLDPGSACQNPLPKIYAATQQAAANPAAFAYNCAQHAHANYVENFLFATDSMLVVGLSYPRPHRGPRARLAWLASGPLLPLYVRAERHGRAPTSRR